MEQPVHNDCKRWTCPASKAVPLNKSDLPSRLKGALRFLGAEDKGEHMTFFSAGWDREGAVILWDLSEMDRNSLLADCPVVPHNVPQSVTIYHLWVTSLIS